jgi:L-lysine 2,3-aminomutase
MFLRWVNSFQVPLIKWIDIVEKAKKNMSGYAKRFKFCMSHVSGKIEILWKSPNNENMLIFKYHQAKDKKTSENCFSKKLMKMFADFEKCKRLVS